MAYVIEGKTIKAKGNGGEKVVLSSPSLHEIWPDYDYDDSGDTNKHILDASIKIDNLDTSGGVIFQKWGNRHYQATVKYYENPEFLE